MPQQTAYDDTECRADGWPAATPGQPIWPWKRHHIHWGIVLIVAWMLAACHSLAQAPQPSVAPPAPQGQVRFPGAGLTLTGEIWLPTDPAPQAHRHPAIVLLHGCGGLYTPSGQLTSRHRDWAQRFAQWGFVTLLVDSLGPRKLGSLCALKDRPIQPWEERTRDAYAALDYLTSRPDVDPQQVFVMGWSHGGSTVTGVVRANAPGRRTEGPHFKAAIAYYPGCERPLRQQRYQPTIPLLIQHGAADDWTSAAPCQTLATTLQQQGVAVRTIVYPEAHHGFDAPKSPVRWLPEAYNPAAPGGRGAHVGTHEPARLQAIADTRQFLEQHGAR